MPLIKSAIKKVRKDKVRTLRNTKRQHELKRVLKAARKTPNVKNLAAFFSAVDKAAKVRLIHKNTASRLKSRLAKLVSSSK